MENDRFVKLATVCTHYKIETTFIESLNDYGLIKIIYENEEPCLDSTNLGEIERIMTLHYDLNINLEGIDVISNLLKKIESMQQEIIFLQNRLNNG